MESIVFPFRHVVTVLKIGLFPALTAILAPYAVLAAYDFFWPVNTSSSDMPDWQWFIETVSAISIVSAIICPVAAVIFAVGIHRYIIRGERPGWILFRFGRNEIAYATVVIITLCIYFLFKYGFAIALFALSVGDIHRLLAIDPLQDLPLWQLPRHIQLFWAVTICLLIYLSVRLSLAFPHGAVTGTVSFRRSWSATRGNFWRFMIMILLFLLPFLLAVIAYMGSFAVFSFQSLFPLPIPGQSAEHIGSQLIHTLLLFNSISVPVEGIFLAMFVALISYTYKNLVPSEAELSQQDPAVVSQFEFCRP